jgi:hypothetical protein
MSRGSPLARHTAWAAVLVLLLRAVMPMFAAGAAEHRRVGVGSICTVYGVVVSGSAAREDAAPTVRQAADSGRGGPDPESLAAHRGDHCLLPATAGFGICPAVVQPLAPLEEDDAGQARPPACVAWADACVRWVARRKQGPPVHA